MENYFLRQIELWGNDTQKSLQNKSILIVGCGGLGSSLAIALGSSGIGKITLVDFDKVSIHNIHRQIAFDLKDVGKFKAEILKNKILNRFNEVEVETVIDDFKNFAKNQKKFDLILDATDNLQIRKEIDLYAKKINSSWIYASVEEFHGQVCFFENAKFADMFQISNHTPAGIAAPIVMFIASFSANLAIRYLTNYPISKDKLYYIYFDNEGEFIIKNFKM